jgi:hypothetical protein
VTFSDSQIPLGGFDAWRRQDAYATLLQTTNCWTFSATKAHLGGVLPLNRWAILNIKQTASISDHYFLAPAAYEPS